MAKAKKSTKQQAAAAKEEALAKKNAEAEATPFTDQPTTEVGDSNDSFSDLGPVHKRHLIITAAVLVVLVVAIFVGFGLAYANKIYPGVKVNGVPVGGMDQEQAKMAVTKATTTYQQGQVPVAYANTTQSVDLSEISLTYDVNAAVAEAYGHGRGGNWGNRLWQLGRAITARPVAVSSFKYSDDQLQPTINKIAEQVDTAVANASLSFSDTGRVIIAAETAGKRLDIGLLVAAIKNQIATGSTATIAAPVNEQTPTINAAALKTIQPQAETYLAGPLTLKIQNKDKVVSVPDIIKWLSVSRSVASDVKQQSQAIADLVVPPEPAEVKLDVDGNAITGYVEGLAKTIDQPGQNAALTIVDNKATIFQPSRSGFTLDKPDAITAIQSALSKPAAERNLALKVKVFEPDVTEASLNSLGINELISEGVTYFPGSPAARMQNIRVGASKFDGVLVKPGEVFSFESLLGEVSGRTGYAPALVILGNREEYQYGGGMCQVSSTAYRAALLAGLPIVERHNHSFAVGYYTAPYGVPGVDATVFNLSVDFKFRNDTGHYILIQTVLHGTTLKFDFYGTKTKSGRIRGPYFKSPAGGAGWNPTVPSTTYFYRDILDLAGNVTKTDTYSEHYASSLDFPVVKELN